MEKKEKLIKLEERNAKLRLIVFKPFDTDTELDAHNKANEKFIDEYYDNQKEIEKLEWELMTPEEREKEEETIRLMKLKRDGGLLP